ncbi:MAG: alpha/beta fold hydrolase [Chloroflexi bacterium]|nr:MAG: alpha/beta fold hydrolase [Chloroflexota bacterium]
MEPRTITVEGLRVRVVIEDRGGARDPVVLIHGVGGWAETWRPVVAPLAAAGHLVVALDLPGFGQSQAPGRVSYFGPEDAFYPRFVLAAMEVLGIPRAHIVGQSMGGSVAYMVAVTAPDRTRSLVLVAAGGLGQEVAFYLRACTLPGMGLLARLPRPKNAARDALRTCFYDAGRIPEEFYEEAVRYGNASFSEFIRAISAGVNIRGVRRPLREAWVARASRYGGPTLAVWGREDYVLPVKHLRDVQRILPQAQAHVIERCGHLAMFERPDEFLAATLPFLDRAEQAAAA